MAKNQKQFSRVAILGLGLMGGSIALEIKAKKLAREVWGYNRNSRGRNVALRRGACDKVFSRPEDAVEGADLVLLAAPVRVIPVLARKIRKNLQDHALVSDVGSTKEKLVGELRKILGPRPYFVGGHPIAGTERSGMEAAQMGLFQNRWWLFTPVGSSPGHKEALNRLVQFARALGAKTAAMAPKRHDEIMAAVSHLPHMNAFALADSVLKFRQGEAIKFSGGSYQDITRVISSSPQMWEEICLDNAPALIKRLEEFEKSLQQLKGLLRKENGPGLRRFFSKVQKKGCSK